MDKSNVVKITLIINLILNGILWHIMARKKREHSLIKATSFTFSASPLSSPREIKRLEKIKVKRLTDVVIPLPPKHFHKVEKLLKLWEEYWPCYDPSDGLDLVPDGNEGGNYYQAHDYNLGYDVTLTFYVSCAPDAALENRLLELFDTLPSQCRRCFRKARVHFANLSGDRDTYWYGTTLMFEQLLSHKVGLRWPHYVLYMEPDLLPIRRYWLTVLDSVTREPNPEFWMKGSLFKGQPFLHSISVVPLTLHLNGNAIYNLADRQFRDFYYGKVYNMSRNDPKNNHAYDLDMYFYLTHPPNFDRVSLRAHKFLYTEVIQNYYHTEYSVSKLRKVYPNAYLVHGGTMIP